jgi:hypothetical protein
MMPTELVYIAGGNQFGLHRHPVSRLEYLCEMVVRRSSLRNVDDVVLSLVSQPRCFPVPFRRVDLDICGWLRRFDDFKLLHGDCVFGSAVLLFVADMSPMVVSLALTARVNGRRRRDFS